MKLLLALLCLTAPLAACNKCFVHYLDDEMDKLEREIEILDLYASCKVRWELEGKLQALQDADVAYHKCCKHHH